MLIKIHSSCRTVVAVCDKELIDKKFEEGIKQIDLTTTFFKGEEKNEEEAKNILIDMKMEDASFFFVGKEACNLAKELSIMGEESILYVKDIPIGLVLL